MTPAALVDGRRMALGRWGATALLAGCFTVSYVDRQVMSLLVAPIKAAFALDDGHIGLLQGVSFSIFYVLASLPLAWAADRVDRTRLMAVCITAWSVASIACGLAQGFASLMVARIVLAMAEAGLPVAAITLLADLHDRRGLSRALAAFMLAPFVGGGLALLIGGQLYPALDAAALPFGLAGWQALFILAGLPGLLLAPLVAGLVVDPRHGMADKPVGPSVGELARYLRGEWRFFAPYMLALALLVMVLNAQIAWMPSAILRRFDVGEAGMGARFGIVYLVAGSIGTLGAGWRLACGADDTLVARTLRQMLLSAALLVPAAALAPIAPGLGLTLALAAVAVFATSAVVGMGALPLQIVSPPQFRAQLVAFSTLLASLLGTGLGPIAVGFASDAAARAGATQPLPIALATVGGVAALLATALMAAAGRAARGIRTQPDPAPLIVH